MANKSGSIYGSYVGNTNYGYSYNRLRIDWYEDENSISASANTSKVYATAYLENSFGSYSDSGGEPWSVTIDGTTTSGTMSSAWNASTVTVGSASKTVTHSTDGSKSITISAYFNTQGTSTGAVSASGTVTLTTIPRYPTSNQSLSSKTDTTITMNWSSDSTCDCVWYSTDNGTNWSSGISVNGKSGSYTIAGLSPKTKYNIITEVRRKDSQLHKRSSALAVTTYSANYFTLTLEDQTTSGSLTQLKVKATTTNTEENNTSKIYSLLWEIYPSGNSSMKETVTSNGVLPDNGSVTQTFTKLITGTAYIITAKLYKGNVSGGTLVKTQSMTLSTEPLDGTFKLTARSSSVIHVALEGLPALEYATRVDISYKRSEDSAWTQKESTDISSGSSRTVDCLLSGLTQMTLYDFKAQVYKVDGTKTYLLKTYELTTSTLAYIAGLETMIPYIRSSIVVPKSGKGYIMVGLSDTLPTGLTVHLYESMDNETYTDLGDVGDDMIQPISGTIGSTAYYKFALVDRNDNTYNETEPMEITYTDLPWITRVSGEPFDVTANDMRNHAQALLSLYDYLLVEGDPTDAEEYYEQLTTKMGTIRQGVTVEGDDGSGFKLIGQLASSLAGATGFTGKASGEPITAQAFNDLNSLVSDAIETIM